MGKKDSIPRILLVEEDEVLSEITAFRLELLGYQVEQAHSAAELREKLNETINLIILDSHIPDCDGIDLVNRLSSDPHSAEIPILIFSADADLDQVQRAFNAGARDFLVTPYDPAVLEAKVEHLLEPVNA